MRPYERAAGSAQAAPCARAKPSDARARQAWIREFANTSVKLGGYGPVKKLIGADQPDAPFAKKFAAGATSGVMGSCTGNPFDVMKTLSMARPSPSSPAARAAPPPLAARACSAPHSPHRRGVWEWNAGKREVYAARQTNKKHEFEYAFLRGDDVV